jgi:hypothetical protein
LFGPPVLFDGGPGVGLVSLSARRFPAFPEFPEFPRNGPPFFCPFPCGTPTAMEKSKHKASKAPAPILPALMFIIPLERFGEFNRSGFAGSAS